jgi:hypothetical protein
VATVTFQQSKSRAIADLKNAIKELQEAIKFVQNNRFERAENEISDALKFEARAIREINKAE